MTTEEAWRPITGYEGIYEVSSLGRVRSLDGRRGNGRCWHDFKGRILRQSGKPYRNVGLSKDGKVNTVRVHVLVANAFLGPCPGRRGRESGCFQVDHINADKFDNRACNLRWLDIGENVSRGSASLANRKGSNHPNSKLTETQVRQIRESDEPAVLIAASYGIGRDYVYQIRNRITWKHV